MPREETSAFFVGFLCFYVCYKLLFLAQGEGRETRGGEGFNPVRGGLFSRLVIKRLAGFQF